jgi:predicted metal-dependent hydrolase
VRAPSTLARIVAAVPDLAYTVRRSPRAKRVQVRVDPRDGAVEVVLPRGAAQARAHEAVVELRPWIDRRLARAAAARAAVVGRGTTVPYLGDALALVPEAGRSRVTRRGAALLVPEGDAGAALERWYRRRARAELEPAVAAATAALGVTCTRLTVRDQRTRWGSCTAQGALSFNWRLLLAPRAVFDYVVWHEVCHLRVMDHSPRFWALVATHHPGFQADRRWLREHGATLVL